MNSYLTKLRGWASILVVFFGLLLAASPATAEVDRFAIIIGNNSGAVDEQNLRFAQEDASKIREVLVDIGGFRPENVTLIRGQTAAQVRSTIIAINDRLRQRSKPAMLLVYYSGHADARTLHLGGSELKISELEQLVRGSSADIRLLILDSCRSGALTRVKGGKRVNPFVIEDRLASTGVVFLTASAATEDAQESDELKGSFFTHYLVSGLLGAADKNQDGVVVLSEAYQHAYENTLRASSQTLAGIQHPTFRYDLAGTQDVILTRPGIVNSQRTQLLFPRGRSYLVMSGSANGSVVAEVGAGAGRRQITLRAGRYFIRARGRDHMLEGTVLGKPGTTLTVADRMLTKIAYARLVRKGGATLQRVHGPEAGIAVRSALPNSSTPCIGGFAGYGVQYPALDLGMQFHGCRTGFETTFVDSTIDELGMDVRIGKAFDVPIVTVAPYIGSGVGLFSQRFRTIGTAPTRTTAAVHLDAGINLRIQLWKGVYGVLSGAAQIYWFRAGAMEEIESSVATQTSLGVGWFLGS